MIVNIDQWTTCTTSTIKKSKPKIKANKSNSFDSNLSDENRQPCIDPSAQFISLPASPLGSTNNLNSDSSQSCLNLIIHQKIVRQEDVYQNFTYSAESLEQKDPINSLTNISSLISRNNAEIEPNSSQILMNDSSLGADSNNKSKQTLKSIPKNKVFSNFISNHFGDFLVGTPFLSLTQLLISN